MNKKVILHLMTIIMVSLCFMGLSSCGSDDDENNSSISLVGTKWTFTFNEEKYIVDFSSEKEASCYRADVNNNYVDHLIKGGYTYSNNNIAFNEKSIFIFTSNRIGTELHHYYFVSATINGNSMILTTNEIESKLNMSTGVSTNDAKGEKKFTLMKVG